MTRFWKTVLVIMLIVPITLLVGAFAWYASAQAPQGQKNLVVEPLEPLEPAKQVFPDLTFDAPAPVGGKRVRDEFSESRLEELRTKAALAEKRSIERASGIRERLKQSEGVGNAEVKKALRTELRSVVLEAFKARHDLHAAEVALLETQARAMKRKLADREASYSEIVDRRVEELLNPDKQWNAGETKVSDTDVRLYAIQDLPLWSKDGTSQHIDLLILYLEPRVDSTKNGGDKIGSYDAGRGVLVVRGDARKHQQIAQLLAELRASSGQPAEELAKAESLLISYSIANLPIWSKDGKKQSVDLLLSYLRTNYDPPSWESKATRARYHAGTLTLVVQGTEEVHNGIKVALSRLRGQTELFGAENASTSNVPSTKSNSAEPLPGDENKLLVRRSETSVKVEGRFDGNEEIVLVIGDPRFTALANTAQELKDVKELKWTTPVNKAGNYVIEVRQDAVQMGGGRTAPGLVFQVHNVPNTVQGTSNISFTDKDPLPNGKVVIASSKTKLLFKRKTDQVLVTVGHVELPDATDVVPINILIRRKAEANSVNRVEEPVDAKVTLPLPAPQKDADKVSGIEATFDRKNARSVVEAYVAAALAGRIEQAASLATAAPATRNPIESLSRHHNVQRLTMKLVSVNDPAKPTTALAISEAVKLTKTQGGGVLVLTLTMTKDGWSVTDIDFETEESAEVEVKRFLEAHPNAVGLPPLKGTLLPETDIDSRITPRPTGKQLGTVLGKPIHEGDLNKNVSTEDNLKRLLLLPLTEHYCRQHKLDRDEELQTKFRDEKRRAMARLFVLPAELNRHLYEKHGGRVIMSPFGAVAFDGMKKWLEEREKAGDFEITDPELKAKFHQHWIQEPAGAQFASPDQIKAAFDPALTDRFIDNLAKTIESAKKASRTFPFDQIKGHIASIKQRTTVAEAVTELRRITGLDFGNGVDRESRQAWLKWWEHETSCIDNAKDGVREFVLTGVITANGKPVAGANVQAHVPSKTTPNGKYQLAETLSDSSGRYVMAFGIPPFATPEESAWKATFTVRNPPRFVADQEPVVMKLYRQKREDTDVALVQDTLEKNNDSLFAGVPFAMNFTLRPSVKPVDSADTDESPKTEQPVLPKPQDKLPDDKANDSQSGARLKNGQTKIAIGQILYSLPFSFLSVETILRHVPDGKVRPKPEKIECELVKYQVSDARHYPLVGPAQLVQAHFKSTITSEAGREVVYTDTSHLIRAQPE